MSAIISDPNVHVQTHLFVFLVRSELSADKPYVNSHGLVGDAGSRFV